MKRACQPEEPHTQSILVVLPTWVGDFVMATPTLRAIRRRFADAHLTFLMEPNLRELVRGGDWMNECIEWPATRANTFAGTLFRKSYHDLVRELRRRRFDWAVLLPNSFQSALIARLAGAKRRIGYDRDARGWLLTDRLPVRNRRKDGMGQRKLTSGGYFAKDEPPHGPTSLPVPPGRFVPMPLVEYYADLAEAIGCVRPDDRLELFTTPDCNESVHHRLAALGLADHHPLVVVSPGARYGAAKCWLPERFALVCDRLIESDGAAVIITCGPGEEAIARRIGAAMQRAGVVYDAPLLTLGEMKSLVSRSDLLLCNDTGPRHFAKAFDVPVVTIFGPTHPEWTATSYGDERICRIDVDCGPCQQRVCPLGHLKCMTGVTVEMVYSACKELLGSPVGHSAR